MANGRRSRGPNKYTFQASAHITYSKTSWAKANHMAKPKVQEQENILFL